MVLLNKLYKIASRSRKEFKSGILDESKRAQLYLRYSPIHNAKTFVKKSKSLFPILNCWLASVYLQNDLQEGEIFRGTYNSERHTFLLIGGQIVVDVTFDQYSLPNIYVGPLRYPWKK